MNIELYNPKLNWHIMPDNDEYISVLREQGVSKFNPIEYYKETLYQKSEKKVIKRSKKAQKIIDDNIKEKNEELKNEEEIRINNYLSNITDIDNLSSRVKSMMTDYGKLKLKLKLLQLFLEKNYNIISHIIFFSLQNDHILDELLDLYNEVITEYKEKYENTDLLELQLNYLSSYLPPIDPFNISKLTLDDWQLDTFNMIEQKKNILICAPTSAGKTVVSSYCAVLGHKTIFVVPSDELARQVGGIFRNLSGITVKIVTNKEYFCDTKFKVLVGTPNRLEEYLTMNGVDEFTYAIFDEWHMLNSKEGGAYEKIFKLLKCPFLALSATLEDPERIRRWMMSIKNVDIELIEYKKRFIIQQRYLWDNNKLTHLHPLSCIDLDYLKNDGFNKSELSFTPRDSFDLYKKICENVTIESKNGKPKIHPINVLQKDKWDQINLTDTIKYENELKNYLTKLSFTDEDVVKKILDEYKIDESNNDFNLIKLIKTLLKKNMCPVIFFKINPIRCLDLFKKIVLLLEEEQNKKYPHHNDDLEIKLNYYEKFINKVKINKENVKVPKDVDPYTFLKEIENKIEDELLNEMKEKYTIMINRRIEKIKDNDDYIDKVKSFYEKYYLKELEDVLCQENLINIDKNRPHPEYCFNNMGIDSHYMRKIRRELKNSLKTQINYTHPFLIGIERGIIPYFKDMEVPFQRIAQSLFSNKKIPVVISDESLGFGINLPIKTVVMLGEKDTEIIDPVLANQMIGRSGRRGIDKEGHVVFAGVNWKDILRNKYNKLVGMNPNNEFLPLPFYFNKYRKEEIDRIFTNTLYDYSNGNNFDKRGLILSKLKSKKYIRKENNALLIWSCRNFDARSFYLPIIIEGLLDGSENDIFESICSLFDKSSDKIDSSSKILTMFDEDVDLYSPKYLLELYKKNKINEKNDIHRLKNIANIISNIYTILDGKKEYYIYNKKLNNIFNNIKVLIKKNLF